MVFRMSGVLLAALTLTACSRAGSDPVKGAVIGHQQATLAALRAIPAADIVAAKQKLVVAYGHTSHGSQIPSGMGPLDRFMGGRGLYTFNRDGAGGALRLLDGAMPSDCGYVSPNAGTMQYEIDTRRLLGEPTADGRGAKQPAVNVIMWSFCGQMSGFDPNKEVRWYLDGMGRLEKAYPGVRFVYMTGHLDGTGVNGRLNQNNEIVRAHCRAGGKWLYDFADIESYDPDGKEYLSRAATDGCDYQGGRNWARDWQAAHKEGVDWYNCDAAHSQALNGNRKAYAAWALFAALARG
ncbi:MAG: hypothetical protein HZB16_13915 [Armatimonadetes bacterium]|nr:hypothetical protein [Armatimonadota bacterium]